MTSTWLSLAVAAAVLEAASGYTHIGSGAPFALFTGPARSPLRARVAFRKSCHAWPRAAAEATATPAGPHSKIAEWVVANGGYVHPALRPVDRGEAGIGLSLVEPVLGGQVLVALPPRLMVTAERLSGSDATAVELEVPPNKWDIKLALALLALMHDARNPPAAAAGSSPTKSKGGFGAAPSAPEPRRSSVEWATYFETLPDTLESLPIFYTGAQLREFEAEFPSLTGEVGGRIQLLKSVSSALPKQGSFAELTLRKLAWAYGIVSSRAVRLEGEASPGVLLPLLDLANHDFSPSAEIRRLGQQKDAASAQVPECYSYSYP